MIPLLRTSKRSISDVCTGERGKPERKWAKEKEKNMRTVEALGNRRIEREVKKRLRKDA